MRFCTNCGKEMDDDAVFCIGCGTNMGSASGTTPASQAEGGSTIIPEQSNTGGAYYQPSPQPTPQATPTTYTPPGAQGIPSAPYYQTGAQGTPGTPYYQNGPYNAGGPNYPGGGPVKNNKMVVIIVSVIVGLFLIAGGIFAYFKVTNKDNDNNTSLSDNNNKDDDSESADVSDDAEPSDDSDDNDVTIKPSASSKPEETDNTVKPSSEGLDIFDAVTEDNIIAACEDTGMDITKIKDVEEYGYWFEGDVYTFTYYGSVIDVLLYDDGTVFSLETGGVQVYLTGYSSYSIDEFIGSTTHFDESYPDNGYAFYVNGSDVDSSVNMETSYDFDYVIEFVDANDDSLALAFFMPAGQTLLLGVPTGDYYIQYAAGVDWQGVDYLFGDDTLYYRSDSIYAFYPENDSTITLDIYGGAGIPSTEITLDDF